MLGKFLSLVRFSHTIFALPFALGALWIASQGLPSPKLGLAVLVCMVTARNVAMAFNRLWDRDIDAVNPRTEKRHLVTGELSVRSVQAFIAMNSVVFVLGAAWLNPLAGWLALPTLAFLCAYTFFKRFSWTCHLYLGLSIGLSPVGAWVAARGEIAPFALWLGLILALWIAGFDIVYATQDYKVDQKLGLHSIPARFGIPKALGIAALLHALMFVLFVSGGMYYQLGWSWHLASALVGALLLYIHLLRRSADLDSMNKDFFLANSAISVLVLVALLFKGF